MTTYLARRVLYAIPILIGVNLITFLLFFVVNTPDEMARLHLGEKYVTQEGIDNWKRARGYDKPMIYNTTASGIGKLTDTIFFNKSMGLFAFRFGTSDTGRSIRDDIAQRMGPSLAIALPTFVVGILTNITFALLLAFFRATYIDLWGVVLCVVMMSISTLFYIIAGQYWLGKLWHLVPISGYDSGLDAAKFLILPVLIGVVTGIGAGTRWYRTLVREEIGKETDGRRKNSAEGHGEEARGRRRSAEEKGGETSGCRRGSQPVLARPLGCKGRGQARDRCGRFRGRKWRREVI